MTNLTFINNTNFIAQFIVLKGEQVVARLPGVAPQAKLQIPSDDAYQVTATTILGGNTYTTAPQTVSGAMGFVAQVKQNVAQGTYDFEMKSRSEQRGRSDDFPENDDFVGHVQHLEERKAAAERRGGRFVPPEDAADRQHLLDLHRDQRRDDAGNHDHRSERRHHCGNGRLGSRSRLLHARGSLSQARNGPGRAAGPLRCQPPA